MQHAPFTIKYFSALLEGEDFLLHNHSTLVKIRKFNIDVKLNIQLIFKF